MSGDSGALDLDTSPLQRQYWPSLVLSCSPDHKLTPIQMQKALFLIGKNLPKFVGRRFYEFEPHNYGPFSVDIYRDLEELCDEGLVGVRAVPAREWNEYEATLPGLRIASEALDRFPVAARSYIERVVTWTRRTSLAQLLGTIYRTYPEYAVRSVFRGPT